MPTNLPLILLVLTLASGALWLLERIWLARTRSGAISTIAGASRPGAAGSAGTAGATSPLMAPASAGRHVPAWLSATAGLFPVTAAVFVFRSFLFEPYTIPSLSMSPRLQVGDFILVNKFAYGIRLPVINREIITVGAPKRGDVMVFLYPREPDVTMIKRVIGLPGDRVVYRDKRLTINGRALGYQPLPDFAATDHAGRSTQLSETLDGRAHNILHMEERPAYVPGTVNFPGRAQCDYDEHGFACTVPAGQYFMMGDNRDNSSDSRYWGFVPDQNIVGKAFVVWMNFHQFSQIGAIQ